MSIYIKGMKIPKVGVYTCELDVLDENTAVLTIYTPIDELQRSYQLTPIPEGHGRLGDLDELERKINGARIRAMQDGQDTNPYWECGDIIASEQTIVPAERRQT